jgi:uncharacterized protein YjbI with pentapeptide repeats
MTDSSDLSLVTPSSDLVLYQSLPNLIGYGYQVLDELGHHHDRQRLTYLATNLETGQTVVVKLWENLEYEVYLPEIERLKQLNYPTIPRYLDSFATPTGFCVVREYQSGIPLSEVGALPIFDVQKIADVVLETLCYLQQQHPIAIHHNLKPENIIVTTKSDRLRVYVVDFSFDRHSQKKNGREIDIMAGSPGFVPPERLAYLHLSSGADIYSLGVTLVSLLTGTPTNCIEQLLDRDRQIQFQHLLPNNIHPQFTAWLTKMVASNYQRRYLDAASARLSLKNLSIERGGQLVRVVPKQPKVNRKWLRWGAIGVLLMGLSSFFWYAFLRDENEPVTIDPRTQMLQKQAAFEETPIGKLMTDKRCISCNFKYQNFSKADLSNVSLHKSQLIGTNFASANLTAAILQDADLTSANLNRANLSQAALYGTRLVRTDLVGANLTQAKLVYAKLSGAWLKNAKLTNADAKFADFQQADLTRANLTGADLRNADLSYANLKGAIVAGTLLDGANLKGATMPDGSIHP